MNPRGTRPYTRETPVFVIIIIDFTYLDMSREMYMTPKYIKSVQEISN